MTPEDTAHNRCQWVAQAVLFGLYTGFPFLLNFRMLGSNFQISNALALISAIGSVPGTVIKILSTIQGFGEGSVQLRHFAHVFNLESAAVSKERHTNACLDFLRMRQVNKGNQYIIKWQGVVYESKQLDWQHHEERPAAGGEEQKASLPTKAKVVPTDEHVSNRRYSSVGNKMAHAKASRRFIQDCTIDQRHHDIEIETGGVVGVVFPGSTPRQLVITFMRIVAGLTPPDEGVMYLPPFAIVLSVTPKPLIYAGTLMTNLHFACSKIDEISPSDDMIEQVCVACGLHPQLLECIRREKDWSAGLIDETPLEMHDGGFFTQLDALIVSMVQTLVCMPDVLVFMSTDDLWLDSPVAYIRILACMQVFSLVQTFDDLLLLPAATAALLQRRAVDSEGLLSQDHEGQKAHPYLLEACKATESLLRPNDDKVAELLAREQSRTVMWPCRSSLSHLLAVLGIQKQASFGSSLSDESPGPSLRKQFSYFKEEADASVANDDDDPMANSSSQRCDEGHGQESNQSVSELLKSLNLHQYTRSIKAERFEAAVDLAELTDEEVNSLGADLKMKRGELVRLRRWIKERRARDEPRNLEVTTPSSGRLTPLPTIAPMKTPDTVRLLKEEGSAQAKSSAKVGETSSFADRQNDTNTESARFLKSSACETSTRHPTNPIRSYRPHYRWPLHFPSQRRKSKPLEAKGQFRSQRDLGSSEPLPRPN
mmetsp:Transcript_48507/g.136165  ORF Transcript_48507/g.136165 Transcript_48507/m.136165 type:complete len:710 (-) Transcript_48507:482-2611(-)